MRQFFLLLFRVFLRKQAVLQRVALEDMEKSGVAFVQDAQIV